MKISLASGPLRWAVPGLVAAGVAVAAAVVATTSAGASQPDLPARTPAQLIAAVEQARSQPFSGTVVETANLGLPNLPAGDVGGNGLSLQGLLTGSHTMRIWYGDQQHQRIALLASMAERDVIRNGRQLWTFTSTTNTVTQSVLPEETHANGSAPGLRVGPTPQALARRALAAIDPSTEVVVDHTAKVAGRSAYLLDLMPRDSRSLIGSVRIAIDAATSMPLQVQVFARNAGSPAFQVGFTDISFAAPSPSVFRFVKPPGATVAPLSSLIGPDQVDHQTPAPSFGRPRLLGGGWTSVVEIPATSGGSAGASIPMLHELAKPVPGGDLFTTALLSVLISDSGTIYAGPVSAAALEHVAATGHGL